MSESLPWWSVKILRFLEDVAWWSTSDVGTHVWGDSFPRSTSASAMAALAKLEAQGLVVRDTVERPVIWRRTEAGRAALDQEGGRDG